jgi:tripartite-type tricarboxylate transporter receptor subunit TctC
MERGEVQGMIGQDWDGVKTGRSDWIRDRKIRTIMQIALTRAPDLPDTPTVMEFAKDPADRQVLGLFVSRQKYSRPFTAPPGLPDTVTAALRGAFIQMVQDAEFIADATISRLPLVYAPGEEITARAESIYASPPALIERATRELAKASQ